MEKEEIHTQIIILKETKYHGGSLSHCSIELARCTGYVNIIDLLLLPLYYIWEKQLLGTLQEVKFEQYLQKSYQRFCHAAFSYTEGIIALLNEASSKRELSQGSKDIIRNLIIIYWKLVQISSATSTML